MRTHIAQSLSDVRINLHPDSIISLANARLIDLKVDHFLLAKPREIFARRRGADIGTSPSTSENFRPARRRPSETQTLGPPMRHHPFLRGCANYSVCAEREKSSVAAPRDSSSREPDRVPLGRFVDLAAAPSRRHLLQ